MSTSFNEYTELINNYSKILPKSSFVWVFLILASIAQFFSWYGGKYFFPNIGIKRRIIYLWLIAFIQYIFLITGIGASSEVLKLNITNLNIYIHAIQIIFFIILSKLTIKSEITTKHYIGTLLMLIAIMIITR